MLPELITMICNLILSARHGKRVRNTLRTSLWCQQAPHARYLHATIMDCALLLRSPRTSNVLLCRTDSPAVRAARGPGRPGRIPLPMVPPDALLLCAFVSFAEVPSVPAKELRQCQHHGHRPCGSYFHQLVLCAEDEAWPHSHCPHP